MIAAGAGWCLAGAAHRVEGAPVPHSLEHAIVSPSTAWQTGGAFGHTLALDGTLLAAGSPFDDRGGADSGVVGIYDAGTGVLLHELENPRPSKESYFGWSVAVSGSRVVAGAPEDDSGENDTGIAYVYNLGGATPGEPELVLENPQPGQNDTFAWSVAIDGDHVVVGVPEGDSGEMDAGCVYVYDLSSTTPGIPMLRLENPNPGGENFGVSVAISGNRVAVGAAPDDGGGDSCRAYVYDLTSDTPGTPVLVLADETPATNDHFGLLVDISGTRVAVAAPQEDTGAQNAGACYIYDVGGDAPTVPVTTLFNPAPALNDTFGASVALDGQRLIIGSHLEDQGGTDNGRAYVFDLASGTPAVPAYAIGNPTPGTNDFFARSVAVSGARLATGAHGDNTTATDGGIAYLYDLSAGPPAAPALTLHPASPSSDEEFGTAVAIAGPVVVVGAPHDDKGALNAGSAYLFDLASGTPGQPILTMDNPSPGGNDYFGAAVALSGNLVIAAAYQNDSGGSRTGTVYVYNRSSGTPSTPAYTIPNPAPQPEDFFGNAVASSGSLLVVGAMGKDTVAVNAGSAYVYDLSSPTPSVPVLTLENPEPGIDDGFGYAVAISGTRVVIGAHGDDTGASNSGSVYVYETASGTPAVPVATLRNPDPEAEEWFGYSVGISGTRVVAGCHMNDAGESDAGSAYVFDLDSGTPALPVVILDNPAPEPEDYFGISVAIAGTRVVVGASEVDAGAPDAGAAYVYELTSSTPAVPADILDPLDKGAGDRFGSSVAIDGANIVVGAPLEDGNTENRGEIFVFDPDPPSPQMQVEQPPGTGLISADPSIHFGDAATGSGSSAQTVAIRNIGTAALELNSIALFSGSAGDFLVDAPEMPALLEVDQSISFTVGFAPALSGSRVATLRILSNAEGGGLFDITLTGQALSAANDTDGDGLNDVVELQLEALGFDWQVNDEELAAILRSGANATGLYSGGQIQAMHPGVPLLSKDPATGDFTLTVAVKKSVNLIDFDLFPLVGPQMTISPAGEAEFHFAPEDLKAFFLLESR